MRSGECDYDFCQRCGCVLENHGSLCPDCVQAEQDEAEEYRLNRAEERRYERRHPHA